MKHETKATYSGIGFTGLLQIAFIVLKLCNVINWSWWCVLLPTIVPVGLGLLLIVLGAAIAFCSGDD